MYYILFFRSKLFFTYDNHFFRIYGKEFTCDYIIVLVSAIPFLVWFGMKYRRSNPALARYFHLESHHSLGSIHFHLGIPRQNRLM